ncbi:MAG: dihydroorotate dehydrogenase electron transfer subunit [Candidatus Syntrophosphaera sp.]|nr:dihydroorotate dehydrogenase electron transfer subunit [Candidatus Syntrophosphaera sp.]
MTPAYKILAVTRRERINRDYHVIGLREPELAAKCQPGMFFELKAGTAGQDRKLFKPVSVYGAAEAEISFLIKVVGSGTKALSELAIGDPVKLTGPLGNGFPMIRDSNVLLVSGGVGYPPLAYLREALSSGNRITFLHGGACADDVFPCDRVYTLDGSCGQKGLVTRDVKDLIIEAKIDIVYSCGPIPMLKALAEIVAPLPHHVSMEAYMACGVGVCHGCAVPVGDAYLRVCADGPIFNAAEVCWGEL